MLPLDIVLAAAFHWFSPPATPADGECPYAGVPRVVTAACPGSKTAWTDTGTDLLACPANVGTNTFAVGCLKDRSATTYSKVLISLKPGEESDRLFTCPSEAPLIVMVCLDADNCEDPGVSAKLSYVAGAA